MAIKDWSTVPSDNATIDADEGLNFAEGQAPGSVNDSIRALMAAVKNSTASETAAGLVELATAAEALAGIDTTRAVTSAGLASVKSLSNPGYYKFPGGLLVQWGQTDVLLDGNGDRAVLFPMSFASAVFAVAVSSANVTTSGAEACGPRAPAEILTNQFIVRFRPNPGAVTRRISYVAVGI